MCNGVTSWYVDFRKSPKDHRLFHVAPSKAETLKVKYPQHALYTCRRKREPRYWDLMVLAAREGYHLGYPAHAYLCSECVRELGLLW